MTEDEADKLVETLFDEITKVETVNGKPRVTDEQTIVEMDAKEMEHAIGDLTQAWRRFREFDRRHADAALDPAHSVHWWRLLECLALADTRMKECFCGRDRSPASLQQHEKFRRKMLLGERYRTDA